MLDSGSHTDIILFLRLDNGSRADIALDLMLESDSQDDITLVLRLGSGNHADITLDLMLDSGSHADITLFLRLDSSVYWLCKHSICFSISASKGFGLLQASSLRLFSICFIISTSTSPSVGYFINYSLWTLHLWITLWCISPRGDQTRPGEWWLGPVATVTTGPCRGDKKNRFLMIGPSYLARTRGEGYKYLFFTFRLPLFTGLGHPPFRLLSF